MFDDEQKEERTGTPQGGPGELPMNLEELFSPEDMTRDAQETLHVLDIDRPKIQIQGPVYALRILFDPANLKKCSCGNCKSCAFHILENIIDEYATMLDDRGGQTKG